MSKREGTKTKILETQQIKKKEEKIIQRKRKSKFSQRSQRINNKLNETVSKGNAPTGKRLKISQRI